MLNTVVEVGKYAFRSCENLKIVTLSESLKEIETYTFEDCVSLESISIPAGVTYVYVGIAWNRDAFSGCVGLKNIFVDENNENYCDIDGVLYNKEKSSFCIIRTRKAEN